jgi:penicillin-binding protein 1A
VPSLALGTSPVTLKEMVSAYGTIANLGGYVEPVMVTRIEDRNGEVLADFAPAQPQQELPADAARTLVDVMRDVVNRGTGSAIRGRFGVRGDVAGKTGTTQGNADGWFILIHPQLVAGAWVGFNDSRVTLRSDYWGQGAHSALPIVGDFFQRAQRSKLVDTRVRFATEQQPGWFAERSERLREWFQHLFPSSAVKSQTAVTARNTTRRAPVATASPGAAAEGASAEAAASAAAAASAESRALPPLLSTPGDATASGSVTTSVLGSEPVHGDAQGAGAAALAPTPTPDDVVPPDAVGTGSQAGAANGSP